MSTSGAAPYDPAEPLVLPNLHGVSMKVRSWLASSLLVLGLQSPLHAQNLPGTLVSESSINADVRTLFTLAAQAYPGIFTQASDWRSHGGYTYRYFATSGIYAGVKDGTVY